MECHVLKLQGLDLQWSPESKEGLGGDDLGMAKGKCFPTMQKNRQWVFPHSKIHVISAAWKGMRAMRYTQSHPLHQWNPGATSSATNSRTSPPSLLARHHLPAPNPCTLTSFSLLHIPENPLELKSCPDHHLLPSRDGLLRSCLPVCRSQCYLFRKEITPYHI